MKIRRSAHFLVAFAAPLVVGSAAVAQSLDPQKPTPLQAGPNSGTVDNSGGAQYFYFWAGPGEVTITVTHVAGGSDVGVEIYDEAKTLGVARATVTSRAQSSLRHVDANLQKGYKMVLAVRVPNTGGVALLRSTGEYEIAATGAVRFDKPTGPPIVGTYIPLVIYDDERLAAQFKPDGTLEFASGTVGTWRLFDENTMIYTVTFRNQHLSLKLIPGQGLVNPSDGSVVFKATR
jgi:hypothetical protein